MLFVRRVMERLSISSGFLYSLESQFEGCESSVGLCDAISDSIESLGNLVQFGCPFSHSR